MAEMNTKPSMWIKRPTRCHLVLYLFLFYKLLNMFRATLCPSSGADDLVVFFRCVAVPWLCRQSDPVGCLSVHWEALNTTEEMNVFQSKNFTWKRTPPKVARSRRENLIVRLSGCVDEAENANTPLNAFSRFIFHDILNIILTHTHQKIHDYLFNFTGKVQKWMQRTSLGELRFVIGLLIYGGVFESLHQHIQSLYKMDGTGKLDFPLVMAKNRSLFLLSVVRFYDKAKRTERRLEDKMATFREFWDMFIGLCKSLYLVGSAFCVDEQLLPFRGRCGFRQYMPKTPSK